MLIANDDLIAGILNRNGFKSGNGNRWTAKRQLDALELLHPVLKPAETGSSHGSTSAMQRSS